MSGRDSRVRVAFKGNGLTSRLRMFVLVVLAGGLGAALSAYPRTVSIAMAAIVIVSTLGWLVLALARRSGGAGVLIVAIFLLNRPIGNAAGVEMVGRALSFADDFVLLLALLMVFYAPTLGRRLVPRAMWIGFVAFAVLGIVGGILYAAPTASVLSGAWLALKLPVSLWIMLRLRWTESSIRALLWLLVSVFVLTVAVSMVELARPDAVRSVFGFTPGQTDRLSLTSLKGIFSHPVQSATFMVFTASVFVGATHGRKRFVGYFAIVMAVLSLRVKALVDVAVILGMRITMSARTLTRYLSPFLVLCVLTAVATAGYDLIRLRIGSILGDGEFARSRLLEAAWAIAGDHFPLGTGFGTFGSDVSLDPYSQVYVDYGLSGTYGFRPENPLFATDASWATVVGESGVIGAIFVLFALGALWIHLFRHAREGRGQGFRLASLMFASVLLIDSLASPRLFDGFACVGLGVLVSLAAQTSDRTPRPDGPAIIPTSASGRSEESRA